MEMEKIMFNEGFTGSSVIKEKPQVILPNPRPYSDTAFELAEIFNRQQERDRLYILGNNVHYIYIDRKTKEIYLKPLSHFQAVTEFEQIVDFIKMKKVKVKKETVYEEEPAVCTPSTAKIILDSRVFKESLPAITIITNCPVLIERGNCVCESISGYDMEKEIYAKGLPIQEITLQQASTLLHDMLSDFDFQSASDKSRAIANIITPALIFGEILAVRAPLAIVEADRSQAGKGFLNKMICVIYNESNTIINKREKGVGGLDESFDSALTKGRPFISLDNLKGEIDSSQIESFLTENTYMARIPHHGSIDIDPKRYIIQASSNSFNMTRDLANRSNIVRIRKRPMNYKFRTYLEGNVLKHVSSNQSLYLGAVFAVVNEWCRLGKPISSEDRHDFRDWAKALDWIVQNLLSCAPLMDGHPEAQLCVTSPQLQWLRKLSHAVSHSSQLNTPLTPHDIAELCSKEGIELPGTKEQVFEELKRNKQIQVIQQIKKRLDGMFMNIQDNILKISGMTVRQTFMPKKNQSGKEVKIPAYIFL